MRFHGGRHRTLGGRGEAAASVPSPVDDQLRGLVVVYAKGVIEEEWSPMAQMDDFSDARRDRLLFSRVGMPGIVWGFLIVSGCVTVCFSDFCGLRQVSSQMLMTAALAGTIGAALVLIAELQTPFAGTVRVTAYGFEQLLIAVGGPGRALSG